MTPHSYVGGQVCPLCGIDDEVVREREGDGVVRFTCVADTNRHPYEWRVRGGRQDFGVPSDGVGAELGVYDTLVSVFEPEAPLVEYGVVEHRFALADPNTYRELVRRYRHTAYGPTRYSASAFLGGALGLLAREEILVYQPCTATGYWKYNSKISAWGLPSETTERPLVTWSAFALESGHSPNDWPALGYRADSEEHLGRQPTEGT